MYIDADDYALKVEDIIDEALNRLSNSEFKKFLRLVEDTINHYEE